MLDSGALALFHSCEATVYSNFTKIIGTIRMLVKQDDLPPADVRTEGKHPVAFPVWDALAMMY